MELWGITDCGKVRQQNQDAFLTRQYEEKGISVLVVCDGMGGANAGNVASEVAAEAFMDYMNRYIESGCAFIEIPAELVCAVLGANRAVFEKSVTDAEYAGMGTTLTAAITTPNGEIIANVGDSRVYHISKNSVNQITKDHSVVSEMVDRGDLTKAEARIHPNKNLITRALGTNRSEEPDLFSVKLKPGEYLLLCSDGLTNVVTEKELKTQLRLGDGVRGGCERLIALAIERGAPDNVTVVVYRK